MEPRELALPLTRGQLDIWLSQESGLAATEWQLGLLVRANGPVLRDVLRQAIRQVVYEAEPGRVAFTEIGGSIVQRPIDYPDVGLDFYDLIESEDPARNVRRLATAI